MKRREHYLDLARCIAILLVIGLHIISPYIIVPGYYGSKKWLLWLAANELFRAGVPLFFMISGYLMLNVPEPDDVLTFYKKRLPRLLIPLLCWNAVYVCYNAVSGGGELTVKRFVDSLLNNGSAYQMWYVYTLLGVYLMAPFLQRIVRSCRRRDLLVLLVIVLFPGTIRPMINTFLPVTVYLFGPLMEGYLGYFLLGYLLGTVQLSAGQRWTAYLLGLLGAVAGFTVNLRASSAEAIDLVFNQAYSINHYLCAAAIFIACKQLCHAPGERTAALLARASGLVFGVYWVHAMLLEQFSRLLSPLGLPMLAFMALCWLLAVLGSFAAAFLISLVKPLRRILM